MVSVVSPDDGERAPRGRRRDASVQRRILAAATDLFITEGWRGFTLDSVARAAGVGKSSLYLRYPSREELFADLLERSGYKPPPPIPERPVRQDLLELALSWTEWLDGPGGSFGLRVNVESRLNPDFAGTVRSFSQEQIGAAHAIIRRAKQQGELPPDAPAAVILDALLGGLVHHMMTSPVSQPFRTAAGQRFIERLVDALITGVGT